MCTVYMHCVYVCVYIYIYIYGCVCIDTERLCSTVRQLLALGVVAEAIPWVEQSRPS